MVQITTESRQPVVSAVLVLKEFCVFYKKKQGSHHHEEDIRTAQHFLEQLSTKGESMKSFSLRDIKINMDGGILVQRSKWLVDLESYFIYHYGESYGVDVTQYVVAHMIHKDETLH